VPTDLTAVSFDIELFDNSNQSIAKKTVTNVPVGKNKLTTVLGSLFARYDADLHVVIEDDFDGVLTKTPGVINLIAPAGDKIVVDHVATTEAAMTFTWTDAEVAGYDLLFSTSSDMSGAVTVASNIAGTSKALTNAELQAVIGNTAVAPKRYKGNPVYWSVKENGGSLQATAAGSFTLSGQRIFIDIRGDEAITYEVAVIENDYYQGIWMAQNLKTKKATNGNDINNSNDGAILEAPAPDGNYGAYTAANILTPLQNPRNGYYYSQGQWNQLFNGDNLPQFIPTGWKLPENTEWTALYTAAQSASDGNINVLLDPDVYGKPEYGAWGLNLSPVGYKETYAGDGILKYVPDYGVLNYYVKMDGGSSFNYFLSSNTTGTDFNYVPIRFKYIGDE
jgi:uncharacterized protein (TIGR02145 family)